MNTEDTSREMDNASKKQVEKNCPEQTGPFQRNQLDKDAFDFVVNNYTKTLKGLVER